MISREEARRIAGEWHGGQSSGLYALSSSGTLTETAEAEALDILRTLPEGDENRPEAEALAEWIAAHDIMGDYGRVMIQAETVTIEADSAQLYDWAHRPGHLWPCSGLARIEDTLRVEFDSNGLLDLTGDGYDPENEDAGAEIMSDELSAWASDALRDVLPADHPAYAVAVGQFEEKGA